MSRLRGIWQGLLAGLRVIPEALMQTVREDLPTEITIGDEPRHTGTFVRVDPELFDFALAMGLKNLPSPEVRRHVVLPSDNVNSMPLWWQADFRRLMASMKEMQGFDPLHNDFFIFKRDSNGRFRTFRNRDLPSLNQRLEAAQQAEDLF